MKKTLIFLMCIIGIFIYCKYCGINRPLSPGSAVPPSAPLPENVAKRVVVDTARRRLSVVTPSSHGNREDNLFLAPHATIDLKKDGTLSVNSPQFGFYASPFLAYGYANNPRLMAGVNLLYFKYFDFGLFVSTGRNNSGLDNRLGLSVAWNVWRTVDLGLGYDTKQKTSVFIAVKF